MTNKDSFERPYQHRNCDGSWGPLIINGKQVYYKGYPNKPAQSTIEAMKQYEDVVSTRETNSNTSEGCINERKIEVTAHEDCNGTTYYKRGYYENLPNGGFKWIDCGSSYKAHSEWKGK